MDGKSLAVNPERKTTLERSRHRWEDIINMDLDKISFEDVGCIHFAQNREECLTLKNNVLDKTQKNSLSH
jgi:hypothetical protein